MKSIKVLNDEIASKKMEARSILEEHKDGLTEAEERTLGQLQAEIRGLEKEIAHEQETRSNNGTAKVQGEKRNMAEKKQATTTEIRSVLSKRMRGQELTTEERDLDPTFASTTSVANGGAPLTIPQNVLGEVIEKLDEQSPVFGLARKIPTTQGSLTIPRQSGFGSAGFVEELSSLSQSKPQLDSITLTMKRVGAYIQLTDQIIMDSAVDLYGFSERSLVGDIARGIEHSILLGEEGKAGVSTKEFSPIVGNIAQEQLVAFKNPENPTVEELLDLQNAIHPSYLTDSAFIVSRTAYNNISKLQDGTKAYLAFTNNTATPGKPTLFGFPVYVSQTLNGKETPIIFGSVARGYDIVVKQDLSVKVVDGDTTQTLAGGKLISMAGYMDGAVVDPYAFAGVVKAK